MKAALKVLNLEHRYNLQKAVGKFEQGYIKNILQLCNGNKPKASEMLGIRIQVLERKMKKFKIVN